MADFKGINTEQLEIIACFNCDAELDVSEYTLFERILCPNCETELSVPGRLSHFVLIDELGSGAMGMVYRAVDENLDREVALKVMREEYSADEKAIEMLRQEAQAAAALNHQNVVQVYEFGQSLNQPFIVMELVNHGRLDAEMVDGAKVDEGFLLKTARDVSEGLAAAQAAGLTHGDIKPANILYDKQGGAKVVDFGLARFGGGGKPGEVWGTPYYIAPEKAKGKAEDWRSDQYSLGATLWHALAGFPPFDGETPTDVVVARLNNPVPSLQEANSSVTKETAVFVERMMSPLPGRRYPTYASALADIDAAIESNKAAAAEAQVAAQAAAHSKKPKKKSIMLQIMISMVVIVTSLIGILLYQQSKGGGRTVTPDPNPGPKVPAQVRRTNVEPLVSFDKKKLADAIKLQADGSSFGAQSTIHKLLAKFDDSEGLYATDAPACSWIRLYQSMMLFVDKQGSSSDDLLEAIIQATSKYETDQAPAENPVTLAEFLAGKLDKSQLQEQTVTTAVWYQQLRNLVIAVKAHDLDDKEGATAGFKEYLAADGAPDWVYLLKPLIQQQVDVAGD